MFFYLDLRCELWKWAVLIFYFSLDMVRIRITAKEFDPENPDHPAEEQQNLSEGEQDISQVDVDPSGLMGGKEKPPPTLWFGRSLATKDLVDGYARRGYFEPRVCRAPEGEEIPDPREGECAVFRDFFVAGLRFPLDHVVPEILSRFGLKLHQLTPNAFVEMLKFFWAVKTFGGPVSADAFCRLYEMHPQGRKVSFEDDDLLYTAQSGCCSFHPRRSNKVQKIERIELSFCQKNKWEDEWVQYWFYAKIAFSASDPSCGVSYPLAMKVRLFIYVTKADFRRTVPGYKDCCVAFASAAGVISGRDLIEEFLAAKVWPLTDGWLPGNFSKIEISGLMDKLPFPKFHLERPAGVSDDLIVEEVEQEDVVLAGPYTLKEYDSFVECCPAWIRVNHSLLEMKVAYGPRKAPRDKKGRGSGGSSSSVKVSDEPASNRTKKAVPEAGASRLLNVVSAKASRLSEAAKRTSGRPPLAPSSKSFASKAEERKKKGIYPGGYSFPIDKEDMGFHEGAPCDGVQCSLASS